MTINVTSFANSYHLLLEAHITSNLLLKSPPLGYSSHILATVVTSLLLELQGANLIDSR